MFAASNAPWWGVSAVAGVFTLVGAGISQLFNYLSDRRRQSREATQRWDADLKECCVQFLLAVDKQDDLYDQSAQGDEYQPEYRQMEEAFTRLLFVATDEIGRTGRAYMDAVGDKVFELTPTETLQQNRAVNERVTKTRDAFVKAVRLKLGTESAAR